MRIFMIGHMNAEKRVDSLAGIGTDRLTAVPCAAQQVAIRLRASWM